MLVLAPTFDTYEDGGVEVGCLDFSEVVDAPARELKSYSVLWGELDGESASVAVGLVGDREGLTNVGHLNEVCRVTGLLLSA